MSHDPPKLEGPSHEAALAATMAFAGAQTREGLAKILGFLHLAEGRAASFIDFEVDDRGGIVLRIEIAGPA